MNRRAVVNRSSSCYSSTFDRGGQPRKLRVFSYKTRAAGKSSEIRTDSRRREQSTYFQKEKRSIEPFNRARDPQRIYLEFRHAESSLSLSLFYIVSHLSIRARFCARREIRFTKTRRFRLGCHPRLTTGPIRRGNLAEGTGERGRAEGRRVKKRHPRAKPPLL